MCFSNYSIYNYWLSQILESISSDNISRIVFCNTFENNSNIIEIFYLHDYLDPTIKYARHVISVTLCSFGLIGYILTLITLNDRQFDSPSYIYHKVLSFLELILTGYTVFYRSGVISAARNKSFRNSSFWLFNKSIASIFFRHSVSKVVDFVTFCITVDRFLAIRKPSQWRSFNRSEIAFSLIALCTILGIILDVPEYFIVTNVYFKQTQVYWIMRQIRVSIIFVIAFATTIFTGLIISGFYKLKSIRERLNVSRSVSSIGQQGQQQSSVPDTFPNPNSIVNNNQLTVTSNNQLTVTSVSGYVLPIQNVNNDLRIMQHLCYLLLTLVVPYLINQIVNVAYTVCHMEWKILVSNAKLYSLDDYLYRVVLLQYSTIVLGFLLDVTNDFYHSSNFYLYLLFSRRFRGSFRRRFAWWRREVNIEFV